MTEGTFLIRDEDGGKRIDKFISEQYESYSRSFIQQLIDDGQVRVNGTPVKKNHRLKPDERVEITVPAPQVLDVGAEEIPLSILYEDDQILVIDKPEGMVVHPAPGNETGTLVNALMHHADRLSSINGVVRPGIVHRIDKDTTGLLVVAKTDRAHQFLSEALKTHAIARTYYALVHGNVGAPGKVDLPIARNPKNRLKMSVVKGGREAVTHYMPIEHFGTAYTLLKVELETGRTHQIRVHMQAIGHPILGDPLYGVKKEKVKHHRQLLHAKELRLVHPLTGEEMVFISELPEDYRQIIEKLRKMYGGGNRDGV